MESAGKILLQNSLKTKLHSARPLQNFLYTYRLLLKTNREPLVTKFARGVH